MKKLGTRNPEVVCAICGKTTRSFRAHLKNHHPEITLQQYYDTYIKEDPNEGTCVICGKPTKFREHTQDENGKSSKFGSYNITCSTHCRSILNNQLAKENWERDHPNEERYCAFKDPKIKEQIKATLIEKYGVDNPAKSSVIKEKVKKTNEERYGGWYMQTKEWKERVEKTNLKKYGTTYYTKTEEWKERVEKTNLEKYGASSYFASEEGKEKCKQIFLEKFGVDNPIKSEKIQQKIYNTKKKNKTFNTSNLETQLYKSLCTIFGPEDIEREYKDTRYRNPENQRKYHCDFYIKSLDIFIELQGMLGHGTKPYNPNDEPCVELSEKMKILKNLYKHRAFTTYTYSDPNKRYQAKKNNLNYLEIFTRKDYELANVDLIKNFIENFLQNKKENILYEKGIFKEYEFDILTYFPFSEKK